MITPTVLPDVWSIVPTPVDHPDSITLLRAYLGELISRYYDRPAEESEISEHVGDGTDLVAPHGVFLLARADGVPVGCAGVRWLGPEVGELTRVFVQAEARRGGGGARMVAAAEDAARARGVRRMLLNTRKDLTEAIALYTRLGYRPTDPYGDDPFAQVWLEKPLDQPAARREFRSPGGPSGCMLPTVIIRNATLEDWPAIWPFLQQIVAAGDTFTWDRDITEQRAREMWLKQPPGRTVVAVDTDGTVLGTAEIHPNQAGPGSHIANAGFMVHPAHSGRGVGRALAEYVIEQARADGYRGMQYNAVVSTNTRAVQLWQSLGFEVIGVVPEGFLHADLGYVDLLIMYRKL